MMKLQKSSQAIHSEMLQVSMYKDVIPFHWWGSHEDVCSFDGDHMRVCAPLVVIT